MKRANFRKAKPEPARVIELQCELKDIDEVAHQQLPSYFAISFEGRFAQPRHRVSKSLKQVEAREGTCRQIATGLVLEQRQTCYTSGEGGLWSFGPLCDVCELQGKR